MKTIRIQTLFALVLAAGSVAVTLSLGPGATSVSASSERNGKLHITKECSAYTGAPGSFCTITSSNLAAIPVGSIVLYDQPIDIPAGLLDSNVVLDAGNGNRAIGRCMLDLGTALGLCTFSDGTKQLTGFHARVDVSPASADSSFRWSGTYSFTEPGR